MISLNYYPCNLCNSSEFDILYQRNCEIGDICQFAISDADYGKHFQIVKCRGCGLVYANPRPVEAELSKLYETMMDIEYSLDVEFRAASFSRILNEISKLQTPGKILDVGCGSGLSLALAQDRGWQTYGVELSKWACQYAKDKYGIEVFNGTLREAGFQSEYFDTILMIDILEHVPDPSGLIMEAAGLLKSDGILCIVTPDFHSLPAKILREKWWHIRIEHIYYFTFNTLHRILTQSGFSLHPPKRFQWTLSSAYLLSRAAKFLRLLKDPSPTFNALIRLAPFRYPCNINLFDSYELYAIKSRTETTVL